MGGEILKFYSRKDIQKEIVRLAQDREVAVMYRNGFGKRPDILQFEGDVLELARNGAISFHVSEERWKDPLQLQTGMTKNDLDKLRMAWDMVLDIDTRFLEYAKIAAHVIVNALRFHGLKQIYTKFSGNTGIHIGIPFEVFPTTINNQQTKLLFPDAARVVADYMKQMIKELLAKELLNKFSLQEISETLSKPISELKQDQDFNPYSILDIDTVLISSRHMFRAAYSVNEKTDLVSIPIEPTEILNFNTSKAEMNNVRVDLRFLERKKANPEASNLITQAFDHNAKKEIKQEIKIKMDYPVDKTKISENFFPPCIKKILEGIKEDGRKRSVFILINFLKQMNWHIEEINDLLMEWGKKNYEPLREGYIKAQINWHKKQSGDKLPPNCDHEAYYKSLAVCSPENLCKLIKNPVNYVKKRRRLKNFDYSKRKTSRRSNRKSYL